MLTRTTNAARKCIGAFPNCILPLRNNRTVDLLRAIYLPIHETLKKKKRVCGLLFITLAKFILFSSFRWIGDF